MNLNKNPCSGITLVEFTIAGLSAILISYAIFQVLRISNSQELTNERETAFQTEAQQLIDVILQVGQTARACRAPTSSALECDTIRTGTSTQVTIRFERVAVAGLRRSLNVVQMSEGGSIQSSFPARSIDADVLFFFVCDGNSMSGGTCPIIPTKINSQWGTIWGSKNNYFRFAAKIGAPGETTVGRSSSLQSAFFVRNAVPIDNLFVQTGRDQ